MDPRVNPYNPSAGAQPRELAGRDEIIEAADIALDRTKSGRHANDLMLLGLRGVGKTVLLNRIYMMAQHKGFETVKIEAPEGGVFVRLLAPQLRRIIRSLDARAQAEHQLARAATALRNLASAFQVQVEGFSFGLAAEHLADSGDLTADLPELMTAVSRAAQNRDTAIGIFVDEVQYLSRAELEALVQTCHQVAQEGLPLLLVGAGLPQLAALAGNAKSYAERLFTYPEVGPLGPEASRQAIVAPAALENVEFTEEALDRIVVATQGYPYFLQIWGHFVWNRAAVSPIDVWMVEEATPIIIDYLDQNFFRTRFDRLTPLQKKYLRAMAELGPGPHKTGEIADTLQCTSQAVATTRAQLINLGMVWSMRFGETAFTVPLFDEFMKRMLPDVEPHVPKPRKSKA